MPEMSRTTSRPLAGFQLITYGRFWVIAEEGVGFLVGSQLEPFVTPIL